MSYCDSQAGGYRKSLDTILGLCNYFPTEIFLRFTGLEIAGQGLGIDGRSVLFQGIETITDEKAIVSKDLHLSSFLKNAAGALDLFK